MRAMTVWFSFKRAGVWALMGAWLALPLQLSAETGVPDNRAVLERREQLLRQFDEEGPAAVPDFIAALDHETELVRRTAAHLLVRLGTPALEGIETGLRNPDFQVRRIMMHGLADMDLFSDYWHVVLQDTHPSIRREIQLYFMTTYPLPEGEAFDAIVGRLADAYPGASDAVRQHVVETIAGLGPLTEQGRNLLIKASKDTHDAIRETAFQTIRNHLTLDWDGGEALLLAAEADASKVIRDLGFEMRTTLLRVQEVKLPVAGWRFRKDGDDQGMDNAWYRPDYDDSNWRDDGVIETAWARFLDAQYIGTGWYRRKIDLPEVPDWDNALIHFGGVDECARVWLDGEKLGEHDMGAAGWDVPFSFDVRKRFDPARRNRSPFRPGTQPSTAASGSPFA